MLSVTGPKIILVIRPRFPPRENFAQSDDFIVAGTRIILVIRASFDTGE
jgi:hypothetical protein